MKSAAVVFVTVPDARVARRMSDTLVGERLAACVTIVPGAISTYRWKGKVERARERMLMIKTRSALVKRVEGRVRELHPHEVPEILAIRVAYGEPKYLRWIHKTTRP
jgi:periplasmic divalent cation tolerance protein